MSDEELRERLGAAIKSDRRTEWDWRKGYVVPDEIADIVLPVVKRYAAEQLREAADWLWDDNFPTSDLCDHLRERADALTATEPEP